jgi:acetyl esterase/lipase
VATILLLVAAVVLLFLSLWVLVPAPNMALLPLGVGVPELSPVLLVVALVLAALSLAAGNAIVPRAALLCALAAAVLLAIPLARVPATVRRFDEAIDPYLGAYRQPPGARSRPVMLRDLVRGITPGEARVVRDLAFASQAGVRLAANVYAPVAQGSHPTIVQIYGGAWQRGVPGDDEIFARYFAGRGYVVVTIDYRHAPQWQWPSQLEDVRAALVWVREHAEEYGGDPNRLVLIGRSAGAQLALVTAYTELSPVAAVVSLYGPTDLSEGWRVPPRPDPLGVRPVLEAYLGGTPDQYPGPYREASAVTYVAERVPPTLLIYGGRDHIVAPRFGRELQASLRAAGAASVLLEIPWAEHAFDAVPNGLSGQIALYYTERFLAAMLGM